MQALNLASLERGPVEPDRRIVVEVLGGNHQAFNQLIERYWGRIFARVHQLLGNREDAEEVTQDTFSRALQNLENFRWEASFSTWLYQIASNLARNRYWYWRRRGRDRSVPMDAPLTENGLSLGDLIADEAADPADRLRWEEFRSSIEVELARLPERYREIMQLRLLDSMSYEDISAHLKIPIGTVKSRIARARCCLQELLGLDGSGVQGRAQELLRGRN